MKIISNKELFLKELKKGNKTIDDTEEFYNWLRTHIDTTNVNNIYPPISPMYGVEVCVKKDELKDSDIKWILKN